MTKKILIEGMTCGHCVNHTKEALSEISGISNVDVNLEGKWALIEVDNSVKDLDIKSAIDEVGYEVVGIEVL